MDCVVRADNRVKLKEGEKKDKYLDIARELKKTMKHESDGDTKGNRCAWCSNQKIGKGIGGLENKSTSRDRPNDSIIKIGQNTEKSPGDLKRLSITQTLVKNHQLIKQYNEI